MSSGITEKDTMFSVRETPWHGLGKVLMEPPETIEEALLASGLNWGVDQRPIYFHPAGSWRGLSDNGHTVKIDGHVANVRTDTEEVLGVVTDTYKPVQNEDAFRWIDALLGHEVEFVTAGSLKGGKLVWVLVRLDAERVELGGDETKAYMFCANGHDGLMSVTAAATRIRVVCWNTLNAALRSAERVYRFRHTGDLNAKMEEAREALGVALRWDEDFAQLADTLAGEPFSTKRMERTLHSLFRLDDEDLSDRARKGRERRLETTMDLFSPSARTAGNAPGTAWHAYNACVEFADWFRPKTTDQMSRSFAASGFKQEALGRILEGVGLDPRVEGVA